MNRQYFEPFISLFILVTALKMTGSVLLIKNEAVVLISWALCWHEGQLVTSTLNLHLSDGYQAIVPAGFCSDCWVPCRVGHEIFCISPEPGRALSALPVTAVWVPSAPRTPVRTPHGCLSEGNSGFPVALESACLIFGPRCVPFISLRDACPRKFYFYVQCLHLH